MESGGEPRIGNIAGSIQYQDQFNPAEYMGADTQSQAELSHKHGKRYALENDHEFQREMQETVENLKRMPGYKNKIWERIVDMHSTHEIAKGDRGLLAGQAARRRLQDKQKEQMEKAKKGLEDIILETSKTSALQAINLNQLLKKKWSEGKNAYILRSQIKTEAQTRRINDLLRRR